MALTINTNIASLRSNRALDATQRALGTAIQRISSGVKLNSAKDDPSGVATADRLSVQIRGISVAIRNANDGITLAQTAEGALQEVNNILQRIQELSLQGANPSNSVLTRNSLQGEITKANEEITRIANETEFNGRRLLSGDIVNATFQVGTRPDQTIHFSIPAVTSLNLGNFYSTSNNATSTSIGQAQLGTDSGIAPSNKTKTQSIAIRGFNSGSKPSTVSIEDEESARSITTKINALEGNTGVVASASTTLTLEEIYNVGAAGNQEVSFELYGKNAKSEDNLDNAVGVSATIKGVTQEGLSGLISKINSVQNETGISATFVSDGKIKLSNSDGSNISIEGFTNNASSTIRDQNGNITEAERDALVVSGAEGTNAVTLRDGSEEDSVTVGGIITFSSSKPFSITSSIPVNEGSLFRNTSADELQSSQFSALGDINISTLDGASGAIRVTANALEQVSSLRGSLGAIQNRFESTISNLESIKENTEVSRGRIVDTDFAEEVSRFTRAQILQQAGIAILAQANAAPFAVLGLLKI